MIEYIQGKVVHKSPTYIVIDTGGVAYRINISLNTYEQLPDTSEIKLLIYLSIKEDSHTLFGFFKDPERNLFRDLISISGIGPNTAILILSSLQTNELKNAIISGNVSLLKSIKGVGPKTAQRMIVELQDSLKKKSPETLVNSAITNNSFEEAINALTMLGFKKGIAERTVMKVIKENPNNISIEEIIKLALKIL